MSFLVLLHCLPPTPPGISTVLTSDLIACPALWYLFKQNSTVFALVSDSFHSVFIWDINLFIAIDCFFFAE